MLYKTFVMQIVTMKQFRNVIVLKTTEQAVLKTTEEAVASIKTTAADLFLASFSPQRQRPVNRFVYHHFLSGL